MNLIPLETVTKARFGQAGLDAILKYPILIDSTISPAFYITEAEKDSSGIAKLLNFHRASNNIIELSLTPGGMSNMGKVSIGGEIIWKKASNNTIFYIGAAGCMFLIGIMLIAFRR